MRYESKLIEDTKPKYHDKGESNHKGIQQGEDVGFIETEDDQLEEEKTMKGRQDQRNPQVSNFETMANPLSSWGFQSEAAF